MCTVSNTVSVYLFQNEVDTNKNEKLIINPKRAKNLPQKALIFGINKLKFS